MGVQPCLEKDSSCLSDGTDLLALDLTIVLENRRVLECGQECFLVSPTISYLLLQSKAVLTAYRASVSSSPILCSAILLNAMHIGDCYRDFPLRPACCRYPLVSRPRQVMSPVLGRVYGLSPMFQIGRWKHFYRSRFSRLLLGR
jgi:hypothetical protein